MNHLALPPPRKLLLNIVFANWLLLTMRDVALIDPEAGNSKEEQGPWRVEAQEMV